MTPRLLLTVAFTMVVASGARAAEPLRVSFLDAAPTIDGRLDATLAGLPVHALALQSSNADASAVKAPGFRIAYGTSFLYLFVEIDTAQLAQRDRAYQNGDGVVLVVANPRVEAGSDQPTDEFYVLGFSPGVPAARWQQRFVWYRNVGLEMRLLDDTRIATASESGRSFFEILVPWSEVYPFHPWLSDAVGFNVCVTRALAGTAKARYCAVEDGRVDSEQNPRRYERLSFEAPRATGAQAFAVLDRNNITRGSNARLRLATVASTAGSLSVAARVLSGEGTRVAGTLQAIDLRPGSHVHEIVVPTSTLPAAGYTVAWEVVNGNAAGRLGLSVLPDADAAALTARLEKVRDRLPKGSAATLQFQVDEIDRSARALRPYDTAAALRVALDQVVADLRDAEGGNDPIAARRGPFRRAYRSRVDERLQPYSVRIPADYRASNRYPLLVFLHGSGQDDRGELDRAWLPRDFILLAPNGRGTSNWYTADHAQDDIREAIDDVVATYSVDASRIVLSGFSMGGYGVYRTYKEDASRYRALAIFSGIPRVPANPDASPDFLEKEDLSAFARVPMFVFHGGKDRNCPIEQTQALVSRLQKAGAKVRFEFEPEKGHEAPGPDTIAAFERWLDEFRKWSPPR